MSSFTLIRLLTALAVGGLLIYSFYHTSRLERREEPGRERRYAPYGNPWLLPAFLAALTAAAAVTVPPDIFLPNLLNVIFMMFLHLSGYILLLLLVLPLLRRRLSASVCAMLWLVPNYVYLLQYDVLQPDRPLVVLTVAPQILYGLGLLWAAGFAAVLGWKLLSHLRFRRRILGLACPVTEPEILALWAAEWQRANLKRKAGAFPLLRSPAVRTPLSIGFFPKSIRVILPDRAYTREELALILRHELIHISREDCGFKFFMVFCTALCWFNPLVWLAMSKSADDMELSCDESVLLEADAAVRQTYARLLLTTAGEQQGFTTCLSVSARALRYRLRAAAKPRPRRTGGIVAGILFCAFALTYGSVSLALTPTTGAAAFFGDQPETFSVSFVADYSEDLDLRRCTDEAALLDYLSALEVQRVLGYHRYGDHSDADYGVICFGRNGSVALSLRDEAVRVTPYPELRDEERVTYRCVTPIDWSYVESLLE